MRNSRVEYGEAPYKWDIDSQRQCTWFVYYYCIEKGLPAPCYWDRQTQTGSYTNAKKWPDNYREPWAVKPVSYIPVANDIVVFDGEYGHVAFIEKVDGNIATLYQYNVEVKLDFSIKEWQIGTDYTGKLLGYMHCDQGSQRKEGTDQVLCSDTDLRIRKKPSLQADIVGHVSATYYDVLDQTDADGHHWFMIGKDRWIADIGTEFLPSGSGSEAEALKKIEELIGRLRSEEQELRRQLDEKERRISKVREIVN